MANGFDRGVAGAIDAFNAFFRAGQQAQERRFRMELLAREEIRAQQREERQVEEFEFEKGLRTREEERRGREEERLLRQERRLEKQQALGREKFEFEKGITTAEEERRVELFPTKKLQEEQTLADMRRRATEEAAREKRAADLFPLELREQKAATERAERLATMEELELKEGIRQFNVKQHQELATALGQLDPETWDPSAISSRPILAEIERLTGMTIKEDDRGFPMADFDEAGTFQMYFNEQEAPIPVSERTRQTFANLRVKQLMGDPIPVGDGRHIIWDNKTANFKLLDWGNINSVSRDRLNEFNNLITKDKFVIQDIEPMIGKGDGYLTSARLLVEQQFQDPLVQPLLNITPPKMLAKIMVDVDAPLAGTAGLSVEDQNKYWDDWELLFEKAVFGTYGMEHPEELARRQIAAIEARRQSGRTTTARQYLPAVGEVAGEVIDVPLAGARDWINFYVDFLLVLERQKDWSDFKKSAKEIWPVQLYNATDEFMRKKLPKKLKKDIQRMRETPITEMPGVPSGIGPPLGPEIRRPAPAQ